MYQKHVQLAKKLIPNKISHYIEALLHAYLNIQVEPTTGPFLQVQPRLNKLLVHFTQTAGKSALGNGFLPYKGLGW